jgi:hypothetical protein
MVVIVILMLFMVVGICFVLFGESAATSSRVYREAVFFAERYPTGEELLGWALGDLIYDVPDDDTGRFVSIRGHSLARNMYGWNYSNDPNYMLGIKGHDNETPFNGSGRLRTSGPTVMNPWNADDFELVNYGYFDPNKGYPSYASYPNYIRHPERDRNGLFTGGNNAPYTAVDKNNMFLGKLDANGNVLARSFWRDYTGAVNGLPANATLNNTQFWCDPDQNYLFRRALTMRPRPADQLLSTDPQTFAFVFANSTPGAGTTRLFPRPNPDGDVQNVPWSVGNDSIWVDLDFPVVELTTGRKVKPLFAFFVMDLDGRLNLSVAGNRRGTGNTHTSLQGWGRWEMNPLKLGISAANYAQLFSGANFQGSPVNGRFALPGGNPVPGWPLTNQVPSGSTPPYYAKVDFDGSTQTNAGGASRLSYATSPSLDIAPNYPNRYQNGSNFERQDHAGLFNPFAINRTNSYSNPNDLDSLLPIGDMKHLLHGTAATDWQEARAYKLMTAAMGNAQIRRTRVTTYSMDLDRPGAAPGLPGSTIATQLLLDPNQPLPQRMPTGAPTTFGSLLANRASTPVQAGDMATNDWRSVLPYIGKVDLNRKLAKYPDPPQTGPGQYGRYTGAEQIQYDRAVRDRVTLAREIFFRLRKVTNAAEPDPAAIPVPAQANMPGDPRFEALRYLAQLAVNIVDFIDEDDYRTGFNFLEDQLPNFDGGAYPVVRPAGWVFGTELPRLVVNEVYAQVINDPTDGSIPPYAPGSISDPDTPAGQMNRPFMGIPNNTRASKDLRVNFYVELHNPFNTDPNLIEQGTGRLQFTGAGANPGNRNAYQIKIRSKADHITAAWNVTGDPDATPAGNPPQSQAIQAEIYDFQADPSNPPMGGVDINTVAPSNANYNGTNGSNQGYYVVGPGGNGLESSFPHDRAGMGASPVNATIAIQAGSPSGRPNQAFSTMPLTNGQQLTMNLQNQDYQPGVYLQRLASPYKAAQPDPTRGDYNPFVTVDYIQGVQIQDAVLYDNVGKRNNSNPMSGERTPLEQRQGFGRRQPFRATGVTAQNPNPGPMDQPKHTMFRQNGQNAMNGGGGGGDTIDRPFEWLIHYDRQLANASEVRHVSGFAPHQLTQQFIYQNGPTTVVHGHRAPWANPSTRLYRTLEFFGTRERYMSAAFGGRTAGRVNVNTIADQQTFRAICDADVGNFFPESGGQAAVDTIWNLLSASMNGGDGVPFTPDDRPYWALTMPNPNVNGMPPQFDSQYPTGNEPGSEKGLLRSRPGSPGTAIFKDPTNGVHPYQQDELLNKVFSHLTTRSNVFAVWCTVGFFNVRDASARPVKLGGEVSTSLRRRMFAIVDRTNLSKDSGNPRMQGPRPFMFPFDPVIDPATYPNPQSAPGVFRNPPSSVVQIHVPHFDYSADDGGLVLRDTYDGVEFNDPPANKFVLKAGSILYLQLYDPGWYSGKDLTQAPDPLDATEPRVRSQIPIQVVGINPPTAQVPTFTITVTLPGAGPLPGAIPPSIPVGTAISTSRIGNPGPQILPIPYDQPPYSNTVVPFVQILQ